MSDEHETVIPTSEKTMKLQAFHGQQGIKDKYLAMLGCHASAADRLTLRLLAAWHLIVDVDSGEVKSGRTGKVLGCRNCAGYLVATIRGWGEREQAKLHRVVWLASGQSIPERFVPDHINGAKDDNRLANLRLLTVGENTKHRRSYIGSENPAALLNWPQVRQIRKAHPRLSYDRLAEKYSVSKSTIAAIIRRETWV